MTMLFFDITDLSIFVGRQTSISGIQRVAFEFIKGMVSRRGADAVRLSFWDAAARDYVSIPSDFITEMDTFDIPAFAKIFYTGTMRSSNQVAPSLERYAKNELKYRFHRARRHRAARQGNEAPFVKCGTSIEAWNAFHAAADVENAKIRPTHERTSFGAMAKSGDELIVLGAAWKIEGLDARFQSLRDTYGLNIRLLIHDLIPLVKPEHVWEGHSGEFYQWLKTSTGYCCGYIANSENTARDLAAFLREIEVDRPVQSIPLAQVFERRMQETPPAAGPFEAMIKRIAPLRQEVLNLQKVPFVLAVGTQESRKNYWRLAQVWRRLCLEAGIDVPKLVFAGRPGSFNEDFNDLMRSTGNLGGWVEFAVRPTDAELAFLYENCRFTAMVSHYEGWGLPIGESLSFGKTAVVARNSSMPEVGGNLVEYCDANSIESIYAACLKLIANDTYRSKLEAKIAVTELRTWDDVVSEFATYLELQNNA